jgi:alpha-glucosidase
MPPAKTSMAKRLALLRTGTTVVSKLGLPTIGHAMAASVRAEITRRRRAGAPAPGEDLGPGPLSGVETLESGARFTFADAQLEVVVLADDVVRLTWEPGRILPAYGLADASGLDAPAVDVRQEPDGWTVAGGELAVAVSADGAVTLRRVEGPVLRREAPPRRHGTRWRTRFAMRDGETFHGLGVRAAPLDLRGGRYRLWNRDPGGAWGPGKDPLYMSIPVLVGRHCDSDLLTFYENTTFGTVRLAGDDAEVEFSGGALRSYVVSGDVPHLLERYSAITGRPALPPRWALGYHQSRWGYRDAAEIRSVVDGFASSGVPISVVHLDIDYMDGFRVFSVDREHFPDLAGLARHAAASGARLVTIIDPGVKVDGRFDVYREGKAGGHFCTDADGREVVGVVWPGRAAFPDFTDPAARRWWASKYRTLLERGVAGIWHDMNEPATIAFMGDPTLPASTRHRFDGMGGDHGEGHNVYGLLMNRAGWDAQRGVHPGRRPFIVSRSGWAGTQRYAWNWTADVESSWEGLRQQVATLVGLGLSGVPFSGSDIGGFSGVVPDDELYLRWLEFAVFVPFCRTHGVVGSPPREPWHFAPPVAEAVGAWIRFRYRLLPYLYTLAHEAAATGAPPMRPRWWPAGESGRAATSDYDDDNDDDDTFLLGDALLVAPVTRAGARSRSLSVPAGSWRELWTGDVVAGADLRAPLDVLPVLVRQGTIVPLDDGWADAAGPCRLPGDAVRSGDDALGAARVEMDHRPRLLAFHCWPRPDGTAAGMCLDDAGDGDGPIRRDELRVEGATVDGETVVTWRRSGGYPPPERVRVVVHGLVASRALADGTEVEVRGSAVDCAPFDELRLLGLSPAP